MDECKGDVLLVGEGDFSFSVAFTKRLSRSVLPSITSTSLLTQETLFRLHQAAPENIDFIKCSGVKVVFQVDATKLEVNESLQGQTFDRIIFNFPHRGGKSNIKKNRQLLTDFLKSAVEVLNVGGDILLSLCRGQGGTPLDTPVRAWHDSWQAVAIATYVDMILYRVTEFDPEDWPEYSCTGFRSRDQHFFTGGALTYFFQRADRVPQPDTQTVQTPVQSSIGTDVIQVNRYVADKLQRDLLHEKDHPLQYVRKELKHCLNAMFSSETIQDLEYAPQKMISGPLLWENGVDITSKFERRTDNQENPVRTNCVTVEQQVINDNSGMNVSHIESMRKSHICPYYSVNKCDVSNRLKLRATVLDCGMLVDKLRSSESIITAYGDVYRRTWPSPDDLPVQHEYTILIPGTYSSQLDSHKTLQTNVCDTVKGVLQNADIVLTACEVHTLPVWYQHYYKKVQCIEAGYKSKNAFHKTSCNQVSAKGAASFQQQQGCKVTKLSKVIGYMGQLNTASIPSTTNNRIEGATLVILNIDSITQIRFDISSHSLLWSKRPEFLDQFRNMSANDKMVLFQPISYYPPLWRHDLSFFEKCEETFDEGRFIDLVRDIAGDSLTEVILMNVWRDPVSNKISKCYRQIYQSFDVAISHTTAHQFQNAIRLKVSEIFDVELR